MDGRNKSNPLPFCLLPPALFLRRELSIWTKIFTVIASVLLRRSIELDVVGEILPGWNIITNYAYTDAKVSKDNSPLQGNRFEDVPYNGASLWTTYQIQQGDL
ncbi:MAG: TonB-dependent receptor [Nostoc sp.]